MNSNDLITNVSKNSNDTAALIWSVADDLVGAYKPHEYGLVILPMTVIKRFHDCLLPTHQAVLDTYKKVEKLAVKDGFLKKASGYQFYNTSPFTFKTLLADPENIVDNFKAYLNGFSDNVQDILARMDFDSQIKHMSEAGLLYQVISDFCTDRGDFSPEKISAVDMGYVFENLVRRFSESYNEEAGAHFTSRDIIYYCEKEKMDLDVDVARLKLMKANHQSQQYRLEDNILRHFPEQIEQNKGFIAGFQADMQTLAEHPHPQDGFAGMTVRGDVLTDKENAGAALVDAMKEVKGLEPVPIGSYRGFQMSLTLEDFGKQYVLTLKGKMSHRVELGKDPRGNLIRIDNALAGMETRLARVQEKLDSLYAQMETAKAELGKPFPQEQELKEKSARLAQLNIELNIDDRTPMEAMAEIADSEPEVRPAVRAKSERPSVLTKLHAPLPQRDSHPKQNETEKEVR